MPDFDLGKILELFEGYPYLKFAIVVIFIIVVLLIKYKPKNKIGNIKGKTLDLEQSGISENKIKDIEVDKIIVKQK